jgi:hypothetical protein
MHEVHGLFVDVIDALYFPVLQYPAYLPALQPYLSMPSFWLERDDLAKEACCADENPRTWRRSIPKARDSAEDPPTFSSTTSSPPNSLPSPYSAHRTQGQIHPVYPA